MYLGLDLSKTIFPFRFFVCLTKALYLRAYINLIQSINFIARKMTGGTLEVRSDKSLTLLTFGPMDQWTNLIIDQWTNGPMVQWINGPLDQWSIGPMVQWTNEPMVPWTNSPMVDRKGPMDQWTNGSMDK